MNLFQGKLPNIWFTIGPSSTNLSILRELFKAGAIGARLTFSYGTPELQNQRAKMIKNVVAKNGKKYKIIADLAGEKVRFGTFGKLTHLNIKKGDILRLVAASRNFNLLKKELPVNSEKFLNQILKGNTLIVGDGAVVLEVIKKENYRLICKAIKEGTLNPNRGIIAQSSIFEPACLTQKDVEDLEKIISFGNSFDAVALSFVSSPQDVILARRIIEKSKRKMPIIAKIETKSGVKNINSIIKEADAIMIARGDLALFLPWFELGNIVENIVEAARKNKKPYIMATQIAEGLERFAFPTRAEICDLTRWAKAEASAILLSYETAFGAKPVDAVSCVKKIISSALKHK